MPKSWHLIPSKKRIANMKMENVLKSEVSGIVQEIKIQEGEVIFEKQPLFFISKFESVHRFVRTRICELAVSRNDKEKATARKDDGLSSLSLVLLLLLGISSLLSLSQHSKLCTQNPL